MDVDTSGWSGEGDFTGQLLEILRGIDEITAIRVEDAPASRSGEGFALLANELFLTFATARVAVPGRLLGLVPITRHRLEPRLTLEMLDRRLAQLPEVGAADYADEGMLQYLRTERVVAPYQTRGYKLVEMVRVYRARANEAAGSGRD